MDQRTGPEPWRTRRRSGWTGRRAENEMPARIGVGGELSEEPRLADARLARELNGAGVASAEIIQEEIQRL